jgi:hypothetical protein
VEAEPPTGGEALTVLLCDVPPVHYYFLLYLFGNIINTPMLVINANVPPKINGID